MQAFAIPKIVEKLGYLVVEKGDAHKKRNRTLIGEMMLTTGVLPETVEDLEKLMNSSTKTLQQIVQYLRVHFGVPRKFNTLFGDDFWSEYENRGECFLRLLTLAHYASTYGTLQITGEFSSENAWHPPFERKETELRLNPNLITKVRVIYLEEIGELIEKILFESTVQDTDIADFIYHALTNNKEIKISKAKDVKNRKMLELILRNFMRDTDANTIQRLPFVPADTFKNLVKDFLRKSNYHVPTEIKKLFQILKYVDEDEFYHEYRKDDRKGRRYLRKLFALAETYGVVPPGPYQPFVYKAYRERFYAKTLGRDYQAKLAYFAKKDRDIEKWKKLFEQNPVYALTNASPVLFDFITLDKGPQNWEEFEKLFNQFLELDLLQAVRLFNAMSYRISLGIGDHEIPAKHFVRVNGVWHDIDWKLNPVFEVTFLGLRDALIHEISDKIFEQIKDKIYEYAENYGHGAMYYLDPYRREHIVPTFRAFNYPAFDVGSVFRLDDSRKFDIFGIFWAHDASGCVDLDAHFLLFDENFSLVEKVSWHTSYQYRGIRFSGDMTCGIGDGPVATASEVVSVNPEQLLKRGVRYVAVGFHKYNAIVPYSFGGAYFSSDSADLSKLTEAKRFVVGSGTNEYSTTIPVFIYDAKERKIIVTPQVGKGWNYIFKKGEEIEKLIRDAYLFARHKNWSYSLEDFALAMDDDWVESVPPEKLGEFIAKLLIP